MTAITSVGARVAVLVMILAGSALATAHAGGLARVTNGNDSGPGSLRHALEVRQASVVLIAGFVRHIDILSTLEYDSRRALRIIGSGQTVRTDSNVTLLAITHGADLTVTNLHFQGPGRFSILNRGDRGESAGKGIFVDVRDDQTGAVRVLLRNVSVSGVANHGIHISDCSLADDCGGGSGGGGEGSDASIHLTCINCRVHDVGNGRFDADGARMDERGPGSIYAVFRDSSFNHVGADGVEADEGNDGSVHILAVNTDFSFNGGYCDPDVLEPFIPVPDEAECDEADKVTEADIPGEVTGSPDDSCIEREVDTYDSGFVEAYEFGIDLDDGIDGDEAGAGSLWVHMVNSTIDGNLDEGVDMDEQDDGSIVARYVRTTAFGNSDDGFKHTEEQAGGLYSTVRRSSAADNGGKGFVFEEEDDGDLWVNVVGTTTSNNDDGDDTGIEAVQEASGSGSLRLRRSDIADGIDLDGVDQI